MKHIASKLAALLLAATIFGARVSAQEAACSMENATPEPALEAAKTLFGKGDYRGFFNASTPFLTNRDAQFDTMMGGVVKAVPSGFSGCATVLQRRDAGGMIQEVSLFLVADGGGTIALYTMSAPLSGEMKTLLFTFSSDISAVLSAVR